MPMNYENPDYEGQPVEEIHVCDLEVGDVIPSHDGYVHSVKKIVEDEYGMFHVEFWRGPHYTYTTEFEPSHPITILI